MKRSGSIVTEDCLYTRPPGRRESLEVRKAWCESAKSLCTLLNDALALSASDFWRFITTDDTLVLCIDSYLRNAERPFELQREELNEEERMCIAGVDRAVFFCCVRMSTYREMGNNSEFTRSRWATTIYERYLFDIPRLLDFCAVYARRNTALVARMVEQIFEVAPRYTADFELCSRAIAETVLEKLRKRANDLSNETQDVSAPLNEVLTFLHDLVQTLRTFVSVLPAGAAILTDTGFVSNFVRFYDECVPLLVRAKANSKAPDTARRLRLMRLAFLRFFAELLDTACVKPLQAALAPPCECDESSNSGTNALRRRNVVMSALQGNENETSTKGEETGAHRPTPTASLTLTAKRCADRLDSVLRATLLSGEASRSRFASHLARFTDTLRKLNELALTLRDAQVEVEGVDLFALRRCVESAASELRRECDRARSNDVPLPRKPTEGFKGTRPADSSAPTVTDAQFEYVRAVLPDVSRNRVAYYLKQYASIDAFLNAALEFGLPEIDATSDSPDDTEADPEPEMAADPEVSQAANTVSVTVFRKRGTGLSKRELTDMNVTLRQQTLALADRIDEEDDAAAMEYDDELDDAYDEPAKPRFAARHSSESDADPNENNPDVALEIAYGRPIRVPRVFQQHGIAQPQPPPAAKPTAPPRPPQNPGPPINADASTKPKTKQTNDTARASNSNFNQARSARNPKENLQKQNREGKGKNSFRNSGENTQLDKHGSSDEDDDQRTNGRADQRFSNRGPPAATATAPHQRNHNAPRGRGASFNSQGRNNWTRNSNPTDFAQERDWSGPNRGPASRAPFGGHVQPIDSQANYPEDDEEVDEGNDERSQWPGQPAPALHARGRGRGASAGNAQDWHAKERNKAYAANHNRKTLAARKQNRF